MVVAVAAYSAYVLFPQPTSVNLPDPPSHFTVGARSFGITYIATNSSSWQSGLMGRKVTQSTFMLFVLPSMGTYRFWMKGMNASLDIIWLDVANRTGSVVTVAAGVPPCPPGAQCPEYAPTAPSNWVLEAPAGFASAENVTVGTRVAFG